MGLAGGLSLAVISCALCVLALALLRLVLYEQHGDGVLSGCHCPDGWLQGFLDHLSS